MYALANDRFAQDAFTGQIRLFVVGARIILTQRGLQTISWTDLRCHS